jgi:hypothetical protein
VKYITAMYWSVSTLGTVGYGDITPGNNSERMFAMAAIFLGCTVFAYFMTSMGHLLGSAYAVNANVARKMTVRWRVGRVVKGAMKD